MFGQRSVSVFVTSSDSTYCTFKLLMLLRPECKTSNFALSYLVNESPTYCHPSVAYVLYVSHF